MKRDAGFTIFELLVVIGIFAVLSAIAVPNFLSWRTDAKFRGAVNNLKSDLNLGRLSAARESSLVNVEFRQSQYVIYLDFDQSDNFNAGDTNIRTRNLPSGVQINIAGTTFPVGGSGDPRTRFNTRGLPDFTGQTVIVSPAGDSQIVGLNRLGRINTP